MLNESNAAKYHSVITSKYYSDNQAVELAIHGVMSMLLTIVNVLCILLMGVLALKVFMFVGRNVFSSTLSLSLDARLRKLRRSTGKTSSNSGGTTSKSRATTTKPTTRRRTSSPKN